MGTLSLGHVYIRYPNPTTNPKPIADHNSNRNTQKLTEQVKHLRISISKHTPGVQLCMHANSAHR